MSDTNGYADGHTAAVTDPSRGGGLSLRDEAMVLNAFTVLRQQVMNLLSDPRRNVNHECGYPGANVNPQLYKDLYDREAIAARVVEVLPKECWQVQPKVFETEDSSDPTEFEQAWQDLGRSLYASGNQSYYQDDYGSAIWQVLLHADILSGLGAYGVIYLALDDIGKPGPNGQIVTPKDPAPGVYEAGTMGYGGVPIRNESTNLFVVNEHDDPEAGAWKGQVKMRPLKAQPFERPYSLTLAGNQAWSVGPPGYWFPLGGAHEYLSRKRTNPEDETTPERLDGAVREAGGERRPRLHFCRVLPETLAQITRYEANITSPRFGQPAEYLLTFNDPREQFGGGIGMMSASIPVHWSRVVHIADTNHTATTNPYLAVPRMKPVLNRLLDLVKVYGADAEGWWRNCTLKMFFETHPQLGGDVPINRDQLRDMMEQMMNGLQQWGALSGMSVKTVSPSVASPTEHANVQIDAICIKLAIPKRIFIGSERGELASSQDDDAWNDRLKLRQKYYVTPSVICPFIDRLIGIGVLPKPGGFNKLDRAISDKMQSSGRDPNARPPLSQLAPDDLVRQTLQRIRQRRAAAAAGQPTTNAPPDERVYVGGGLDLPSSQGNTVKVGDGSTLVVPHGGYSVEWPDLTSQSNDQRAGTAAKIVQVISQYIQGGCDTLMSPKDFYSRVLGPVLSLEFDDEEADALLQGVAENLEDSETPPIPGRMAMQTVKGVMELVKMAAAGGLTEDQLRAYMKTFFKIDDDQADELLAGGIQTPDPNLMGGMGGGGGGGFGGGGGGGMGGGISMNAAMPVPAPPVNVNVTVPLHAPPTPSSVTINNSPPAGNQQANLIPQPPPMPPPPVFYPSPRGPDGTLVGDVSDVPVVNDGDGTCEVGQTAKATGCTPKGGGGGGKGSSGGKDSGGGPNQLTLKIKQALKDLQHLPQHEDGLIDLKAIHQQLSSKYVSYGDPNLTVDKLHKELQAMSSRGELGLQMANNPAGIDQAHSIKKKDSQGDTTHYAYAMLTKKGHELTQEHVKEPEPELPPPKAKAEKSKPAAAPKAKAAAEPKPAKAPTPAQVQKALDAHKEAKADHKDAVKGHALASKQLDRHAKAADKAEAALTKAADKLAQAKAKMQETAKAAKGKGAAPKAKAAAEKAKAAHDKAKQQHAAAKVSHKDAQAAHKDAKKLEAHHAKQVTKHAARLDKAAEKVQAHKASAAQSKPAAPKPAPAPKAKPAPAKPGKTAKQASAPKHDGWPSESHHTAARVAAAIHSVSPELEPDDLAMRVLEMASDRIKPDVDVRSIAYLTVPPEKQAPAAVKSPNPGIKGGSGANPDLTDRERGALAAYTADGFIEMNRALRSKEGNIPGGMKEHHDALQSAFAKTRPLDEPVTVYRGMSLSGSKAQEFVDRLKKQAAKGGTVTLPGYTSTSTQFSKSAFGSGLRIEIEARQGIDMMPHSHAQSEKELLLNHNSRFEVVGTKKEGHVHTVRLRQIVD